MASQHHFVVVFDTDKNTWTWDCNVEEDHFSGTIFLPEEGIWVNSSYSENINNKDTEASETLCKMLNIMNGG